MPKSVSPEPPEHPDLRGLLALQRTCAQGSVAAAAAELGWSHSTLEHHLSKLERLMGTRLLTRTPRGSTPTEAGRFVSEQAEEILLLCSKLVADVRAARHDAPDILRCAMIPTVAARVVPEIRHLLHESREGGPETARSGPQLEITLDEISPILSRVEQGKLDFAVIVGDGLALSSRKHRLRFELVCAEPVYLCVAAAHPLVEAYGDRLPPLHLFSGDRWAVGTEKQDPLDQGLMRISAAAGFTPLIGMRTNDYSMAQHFTQAGLLITLVPHAGLNPDAQVHRWKLPQRMLQREILLVTRKSSRPQPGAGEASSPTPARRRELEEMLEELRSAMRAVFADSALLRRRHPELA